MSYFSLLEMRGTYAWKPAFQRLLLPFVRFLARAGVRANQVTCTACALSILTGVIAGGHCHLGRNVMVGEGAILGDKSVLTDYSTT